MIVRISTEGQYRLSSALLDKVNEMDNDLVNSIAEIDEAEFRQKFDALLALIRSEGTPLSDDELKESQVILPAPDITVEEARSFFTGEGLLPN